MKKLWNNFKKVKQKDLKLIIPPLVALIVFAGALMGFEVDAMSLEQKLTALVSGLGLVIGVFINTDKK